MTTTTDGHGPAAGPNNGSRGESAQSPLGGAGLPGARNSIFAIQPYKLGAALVFDDPARGLVAEPFVCGADTVLKILALAKTNDDESFTLIFSDKKFPGADFRADWMAPGEANHGDWYQIQSKEIGTMEAWLCPALLKYFAEAPREIHFQIKAKE